MEFCSVNTVPFCAVSSTHPSITPAHSSGVRQYTQTTSPSPLPSSSLPTYSARPSLRMNPMTSLTSASASLLFSFLLWKSSSVSTVAVAEAGLRLRFEEEDGGTEVEVDDDVVAVAVEDVGERLSLKMRWCWQ
ncbi:hypothetical protein VMCG_03017 [Cytospora schulzeri]|uniref:Uncharacterized protein n=1 Tax=Cytospora schulzeri TaxID=448051 RepID=A0A423WXS3_9PEZI|nr:hypothetical protein VMCG_03017 [Valsa malicola]